MEKKYVIGIILILVLVAVGVGYFHKQKSSATISPTPATVQAQTPFDALNASYILDGDRATLQNGVFEAAAAPDSASKITTRYFGNEAKGDLNGDGKEDTAFLLTKDTGGSGVFYYVVAALATTKKYKVTNAILLGDRIAPQSTTISAGIIHVTYASRKPDEPMTAMPSVGMEMQLRVNQDGLLEEVR